MTRISPGRVIAGRTYELLTSTGVRSVTVRIGQAVPDPEPGYVQQQLAGLQRRSAGNLTWLGSTDLGLPDIIGLVGVRSMFRAPGKLRRVKRQAPAS